MTDKLQELTDKLYTDGLAKGREEAERIVAEAKSEAERIIGKARKEADAATAEAERKCAELKAKTEKDVKAASEQCILAVRKAIEDVLLGGTLTEGVKAVGDADFLKEIIRIVAGKFNTEDDIRLMLPEALRDKVQPWIEKELAAELNKGVQAVFSGKIGGGFTIGPADGSYYVSLTEETFRALIAEYLRPTTRKVLFGE